MHKRETISIKRKKMLHFDAFLNDRVLRAHFDTGICRGARLPHLPGPGRPLAVHRVARIDDERRPFGQLRIVHVAVVGGDHHLRDFGGVKVDVARSRLCSGCVVLPAARPETGKWRFYKLTKTNRQLNLHRSCGGSRRLRSGMKNPQWQQVFVS